MKRMSATSTCFLVIFIMLPAWVIAQDDCAWFPAPCPHESEITNAQSYTERSQDNKVTAQELAMESNLRNTLTDILQKLARQKHWQLYELNESGFDRPNSMIGYAKWETIPYEKRPPHGYSISFILVVNKDSLKAWRDWYTNDLAQQANQSVADLNADRNNEAKNQILQKYMDSAQYYAQLSGKYMQDHQAQYMADTKSNNKKGIKEHDEKIAWYQKKSDGFVKKYQDAEAGNYGSSTNSYETLQKAKIRGTETFINASVLLVHFAVNDSQIGFGITDANQKCILPQKTLVVPGAFYAGLLHNPDPPADHSYDVGLADYVFPNPRNIATVLFGGWLHKYDSYNYALASYTNNPANTNLTGTKAIKCDVIQNMAMHIEGRPDHIRQVLSDIDINSLEKIIGSRPNQ